MLCELVTTACGRVLASKTEQRRDRGRQISVGDPIADMPQDGNVRESHGQAAVEIGFEGIGMDQIDPTLTRPQRQLDGVTGHSQACRNRVSEFKPRASLRVLTTEEGREITWVSTPSC